MYIDPKDLSLQDAAGMQLANIIRSIPEGGGGSSSDNGAWVLGIYDVSISNTTITAQSGTRSFSNDAINVYEYFRDRRDFNYDGYSWVNLVIPSQSLTLPGAVSQVDVYYEDIDTILNTIQVSVNFVKLTNNDSFAINGSVTVIIIAYPSY